MKKKVLVVVDYQNDFVSGTLGFEDAKKLDTEIAVLMREYITNGDFVMCTFDTHGEDYLETQEGKNLPVKHCIEGTNGWELYGEVGEEYKANTDRIIAVEKETFGSNELVTKLIHTNRGLNGRNIIGEITLCGVVTNMCVISNAVIAKAACPEARIIIKESLCDSFDKELHKKAIDVMTSMQMEIQ